MEHEKVEPTTDKESREVGVNNTALATTSNDSLMSASNDFQYIERLSAQMENLEKIANTFVKGSLCAAKTVPDFIVATITGQQLGLQMMTSVNNIINIQGRASLATHLMRALILRAGISFEKVADAESVYVFYEGIPDPENPGKLIAKKIVNEANPKGVPIPRGKGTLKEMDETKFVAGRTEVDKITKYEFIRKIKQIDQTYKDIKVVSYFTWKDAIAAGLADKDNYKNYPSRMLDARAFAIGAREIASDILFGMYTVAEMADAKGVSYRMNEGFTEEIEDVDAEIIR